MYKYVYAILIVLILSGCYVKRNTLSRAKIDAVKKMASSEKKDSIIVNPPFMSEPTSSSDKNNYVTIDCFFGTDRNILMRGGNPYFGIERSSSGVHYGTCKVSIPKTHELGKVESPFITGIKLLENPDNYISILNITSNNKINFYDNIVKRLAKDKKNNAYIFVHGYNVSFAQAAKSTAQIYYDFGLSGVPVFYSWPSQESYFKYSIDRENSEWATSHFKLFLNDFLKHTDAKNVYLIAHSMGNRLLINALTNFLKETEIDKERIKEIILVAPDIDFDIFNGNISVIAAEGRPVTLYVSSNDLALRISELFNGHKRAGFLKGKPIILKGVETIDATNVNTSIIGHSYLNESRSISDDIFDLINNNLRANQRHLIKKSAKSGVYWEFYK